MKSNTSASVLAELRKLADPTVRKGMLRFGIPNEKALGIPVGQMRTLAKKVGKDHDLALELWQNDIYEARMMAVFIDDPKQVTAEQMDRWCKDFDNWGICDTSCFTLFDRTPHVWKMIRKWATRKPEFEKRAAFALIASVAGHDKKAEDEHFLNCLELIEAGADDDRNFVKKGVSWALRGIGHRNVTLNSAAIALATQLAKSQDATVRWVGKDVLRDLQRELVKKKVMKNSKGTKL